MDGGSKSGSKTNLNESSVPLLDEEEVVTPEKENIELKEKASTGSGAEKDDSDPEKKDEKNEGEADGKGKKKKKEKKEKKERTPRTNPVNSLNTLTVGLNLLDRDERRINDEVNISFEDVLAEPDSSHGFDPIWRLAFLVFSGTRHWIYRLLSAVVALPCAILWGIVFSLLTFLHIWLISPALKVFELILFYFRKIWQGLIITCLEPVCIAIASLFSRIHIRRTVETV